MRKSRARPDPVSCQLCRTKKLKCNRVQPCSNCLARGVTCNFVVPPEKQTETASTISNGEAVLGRIERLESIILRSTFVNSASATIAHDNHVPRLGLQSRSKGDGISFTHRKQDEDSRLLENLGTREDSLLPCLSNGLAFQIRSVHEILEGQIDHQQHSTLSPGYAHRNKILVTFPSYGIASQLLRNYESSVNQMYPVLYIPEARSLIKKFYLQINQNESIKLGHAALLLSIFAISAFFYRTSPDSEVATTEKDAVYLSQILSTSALNVLDHSRRSTSGTLEDVQANILTVLLVQQLDGFSARARLLLSNAISAARDLRLHRLDAEDEVQTNAVDPSLGVQREVRRRVFWFIASADWMNSTISGPQEGTYFIHPNHISCKLPVRCGESDITLIECDDPVSTPQPTAMTFFLEKVRLAHLCREITDTMPLEISKLAQLPYEQIIALDGKIQEFIKTLPCFLRPDPESRRKSKALEELYPQIPVWRFCILQTAHSRRCKLHQRFLLRQSWDPRYVYSRQACLESARAVIQVYEGMIEMYSPSTIWARMNMTAHYTYLAVVVLVMDLCCNKDQVDEAEVKADVRAALRMFEDVREISPLLRRSLYSVREVLKKHNVQLADSIIPSSGSDSSSGHVVTPDAFEILYDDSTRVARLDTSGSGLDLSLDTSFEEFWRTAVQSERSFDSFAWDNLFSSLDTQPM